MAAWDDPQFAGVRAMLRRPAPKNPKTEADFMRLISRGEGEYLLKLAGESAPPEPEPLSAETVAFAANLSKALGAVGQVGELQSRDQMQRRELYRLRQENDALRRDRSGADQVLQGEHIPAERLRIGDCELVVARNGEGRISAVLADGSSEPYLTLERNVMSGELVRVINRDTGVVVTPIRDRAGHVFRMKVSQEAP
jgi:hypothetical protein